MLWKRETVKCLTSEVGWRRSSRLETWGTATLGWFVLPEVPACSAFTEGLVHRTHSWRLEHCTAKDSWRQREIGKKKKKELHESNDFLCRMHKSIRGRTGRSELFFAMITFVPLFAYSCFSHLDCTSRLMVSVLLKAASQAVLSETKGHKVTDF